MRVIAGKYRRLNLLTPSGDKTRPTLDRIKEALFSILQDKSYNAIVLDLFAGSGALGIEALSRGAKKVYFNDYDINANKAIKSNLTFIKADLDTYEVMKADYKNCLLLLKEKNIKFNLIFLDPPYVKNICNEIITYLIDNDMLVNDAIIVVESDDQEMELSYLYQQYQYGKVLLYIVKLSANKVKD